MRKLKIKFELEEPPIRLLDEKNNKEQALLEGYSCRQLNILPNTEKQLYQYYNDYAKLLLDYYHEVMGEPAFELTNEIRAMFGHLVDYRLKSDILRENIQKAFGHFRRLNLDAFKILCDEYDKFFSQNIGRLYKYDYRKVEANYLKIYLEYYFNARKLYLEAQNRESLGKNESNVYLYYFDALKGYIKLKNHYLKQKVSVERRRTFSIFKKVLSVVCSLGLSIVTVFSFW